MHKTLIIIILQTNENHKKKYSKTSIFFDIV